MRSDAESVDSDSELSQEDAVAMDVQPEEGVLDPPADRESGYVVHAVARFEAVVFVVFGRAYLIMGNHSGYPHAKISMHNRFRTEAALGRTTTSKTFTAAHHDAAYTHLFIVAGMNSLARALARLGFHGCSEGEMILRGSVETAGCCSES